MEDIFTQYDPELRKILRQYKKGTIQESSAMVSLRFIVDMHARVSAQNDRTSILEEAGERILNTSMELYGEANGGINMARTFKEFLFKEYTKEKKN